ncbi:MAG: hypothetical protein FWB76_02965 [Oscillospiraceae bacterium]|nr:hypothetical protein [Oscillospiraceae bacterium]
MQCSICGKLIPVLATHCQHCQANTTKAKPEVPAGKLYARTPGGCFNAVFYALFALLGLILPIPHGYFWVFMSAALGVLCAALGLRGYWSKQKIEEEGKLAEATVIYITIDRRHTLLTLTWVDDNAQPREGMVELGFSKTEQPLQLPVYYTNTDVALANDKRYLSHFVVSGILILCGLGLALYTFFT